MNIGASINGCSLAHLCDGGRGGTSDIALQKDPSTLCCCPTLITKFACRAVADALLHRRLTAGAWGHRSCFPAPPIVGDNPALPTTIHSCINLELG